MENIFVTQWNRPAAADNEYNEEPSLTVPDMSYSVRELLEKFTSGGMPNVMREGQFDENPSFDDIDPTRLGDFDLADLTELQIELEAKKAYLDSYLNERKEAEQQKAEPEPESGASEA